MTVIERNAYSPKHVTFEALYSHTSGEKDDEASMIIVITANLALDIHDLLMNPKLQAILPISYVMKVSIFFIPDNYN